MWGIATIFIAWLVLMIIGPIVLVALMLVFA